jgi:hypothetical protein
MKDEEYEKVRLLNTTFFLDTGQLEENRGDENLTLPFYLASQYSV